MQGPADSSGLTAALQQPILFGVPAPYHHRLPLSAQAWHGAQSVSLSWPTPHGPSSPAALPWDHLLPCSLVHGDARSPAASLVGSLLYLGPLTADGDNPSRGLGLNPSFSCPHRPGEVLADQMNQQYTDHSSAGLTPSCCAVWVAKSQQPWGACNVWWGYACYRVTHREKSGTTALHTRDRGRPGNGQGSCNPFFVAQPWEEHTQVTGPTSPSQCLLPTPQSCLRT